MKKTINIHTVPSTIEAVGKFNSKHCRSVVCKETGDVFTSIIDAAKGAGASYPMMSGHLLGRYKSCKGKHYAYLDEILDNPNEMLVQLRNMSAGEEQRKADAEDARKWREYQAQLAAEEEAARKAEQEKQERIAVLTTRLERRKNVEQQAIAKAEKATARRMETERELAELIGEA